MAQQYTLTVKEIRPLTPHMRRITLSGESLGEFPEDQESGYVKLFFPEEGGQLDGRGNADSAKEVRRSYTIRAFDAQALELVLDFVDHGDTGPASRWAGTCQVGDSITIRGPGDKNWLILRRIGFCWPVTSAPCRPSV